MSPEVARGEPPGPVTGGWGRAVGTEKQGRLPGGGGLWAEEGGLGPLAPVIQAPRQGLLTFAGLGRQESLVGARGPVLCPRCQLRVLLGWVVDSGCRRGAGRWRSWGPWEAGQRFCQSGVWPWPPAPVAFAVPHPGTCGATSRSHFPALPAPPSQADWTHILSLAGMGP